MRLDWEPEKALEQQELPALLDSLRRRVQIGPDTAPAACPYLTPDEERCLGDMHELRDSRAVRRCPGSRIRTAADLHAAALQRCGADVDAARRGVDPVPDLVRTLRAVPGTEGLPRLLELLRDVTGPGAPARRYHLVIHGQCGTAKSHALLTLYFHALRQGQRALWTTWTEWREQAQRAESFDETQAAKALAWFAELDRADVVVLDDVLFVGWASPAERARVVSRLGAYLERRRGRTLLSTNLGADQIRADDALGERIWSRLTETRVLPDGAREPVRSIVLTGADQRGRR